MITLLPTTDQAIAATAAANAATDPAQRVSSHRTTDGHIVYYRCYCGDVRTLTMRWSFAETSGGRRLTAQWVPGCPTCADDRAGLPARYPSAG